MGARTSTQNKPHIISHPHYLFLAYTLKRLGLHFTLTLSESIPVFHSSHSDKWKEIQVRPLLVMRAKQEVSSLRTVQGKSLFRALISYSMNTHNSMKGNFFLILDTNPSLKLAKTRFSVPVEEPESTSQHTGFGAQHGWWAGCGNDVSEQPSCFLKATFRGKKKSKINKTKPTDLDLNVDSEV